MKKQILIIVILILVLALIIGIWAVTSSSQNTNNATNSGSSNSETGVALSNAEVAVSSSDISVTYESSDTNTSWDESSTTKITLSDNGSNINGSGAEVNGTTVTITKAGTYYITGTLTNGSLVINTDKNSEVHIILAGVNIHSETQAAIYGEQAKKIIITLAEGTTNTVSDSTANTTATTDEEQDGAIYSKTDLTINGNGTLNVTANYKDGIVSKDSLKIVSGNIIVAANDDGIRGKDYVAIKNGNLTIATNSDGIKSTNAEDTTLGFILIEGGTINITSGQDGIDAETVLSILGGTLNIKSGGGSEKASQTKSQDSFGFGTNKTTTTTTDTESKKGLKAGTQINIENGTFTIDSADDSIHSNGTIIITGGTFTIVAGDDGIHADESIKITDGKINITKSYEGIEASYIQIDGGTISLIASDDGVNVAGGNDSQEFGQFTNSTKSNQKLIINGGTLLVNASGDGLDANGSLYINGGYVYVDGPTSNGNASLDYDGECVVTGGTFIATGSTGMLQTPSTNSTQYTICAAASGSANQIITIKDSSGNEIASFTPTKSYQSIIISSPEIKNGSTYTIYAGNSEIASVTVNSIVSSYGNVGNGGMMQGGGMQGGKGFKSGM